MAHGHGKAWPPISEILEIQPAWLGTPPRRKMNWGGVKGRVRTAAYWLPLVAALGAERKHASCTPSGTSQLREQVLGWAA